MWFLQQTSECLGGGSQLRVLPYPTLVVAGLLFLDTGLFISCTDLAPCGRLQHPTGRRSRACLPRPGSFRSSWDSAELLCPELVGDSSLTRCPSPCKAQGALCRTGSAPMSHVWIHAQSPRELVPKALCQNEEAALYLRRSNGDSTRTHKTPK